MAMQALVYSEPEYEAKISYYNGRKFRSNLEAKIAEKLDDQGRKWRYEKDLFRNKKYGGGQYTPDFYLWEEHLYIEAVGKIDDKHLAKAAILMEVDLRDYPNEKFEFVDGDGWILDYLGNDTGRNFFTGEMRQSVCDIYEYQPAQEESGSQLPKPSHFPKDTNESVQYVYGDDASASYPDVSIGLVTITPEDAKRLLDESETDWKRLRPDALESVLRNGNWTLNGATISFSRTGKIKDGSKRLAACVRTGIPIDTFLVWGVDDDVDPTIGVGFSRSTADHLEMAGFHNCKTLAAAGRAIYFFHKEGLERYFTVDSHGHPGGKRLSEEDYYNYIVNNYDSGADIRRVFKISLKVVRKFKHISVGSMSVLVSKFLETNESQCERFISQLIDDEDACESVKRLRKKLEDNSNRQGKPKESQEVIGAWFVKTWNAFVGGRELYSIRYSTTEGKHDKFPQVLSR